MHSTSELLQENHVTKIIFEMNAIVGTSFNDEHATNAVFNCCVADGSISKGFESEDINFSALA